MCIPDCQDYIIRITAPPKRMDADSVWLLRCPLGGKQIVPMLRLVLLALFEARELPAATGKIAVND
jgi:hypothetical protein